jgi:hypothetical protein
MLKECLNSLGGWGKGLRVCCLWLVVGGLWFVVGGWWFVVGGWWLVVCGLWLGLCWLKGFLFSVFGWA